MNGKVRMNWKPLGRAVVDSREHDATVTVRLINMDSLEEITLAITQTHKVPAHETIGALRAAAAVLEQITGTPPSDDKYEMRKLNG